MSYKTKFFLFPIFVMMILFVPSCALFEPTDDVDKEVQLLQDLQTWGETGSITILRTIKDPAERKKRAEQFIEIVKTNVVPVLNDDKAQINEQVTNLALNSFGKELSPDYEQLAKNAFKYLFNHVEIPTAGKVMPPYMVTRLKSFFNGAVSGAYASIEAAEKEIAEAENEAE